MMEPRAGFEPAANNLRGCRSTGLSHRGVYSELSDIHVFKIFGSRQSCSTVNNLIKISKQLDVYSIG